MPATRTAGADPASLTQRSPCRRGRPPRRRVGRCHGRRPIATTDSPHGRSTRRSSSRSAAAMPEQRAAEPTVVAIEIARRLVTLEHGLRRRRRDEERVGARRSLDLEAVVASATGEIRRARSAGQCGSRDHGRATDGARPVPTGTPARRAARRVPSRRRRSDGDAIDRWHSIVTQSTASNEASGERQRGGVARQHDAVGVQLSVQRQRESARSRPQRGAPSSTTRHRSHPCRSRGRGNAHPPQVGGRAAAAAASASTDTTSACPRPRPCGGTQRAPCRPFCGFRGRST